jgi:hypothetical protein
MIALISCTNLVNIINTALEFLAMDFLMRSL